MGLLARPNPAEHPAHPRPYKQTATQPPPINRLTHHLTVFACHTDQLPFALPILCRIPGVLLGSALVLKLLSFFAVTALVTTISHAETAKRAIIVYDGSGSMWGQISGTPKHQIARQALRDMLETVPATMELGLMAYGHRSKGNCNDIELLVTPGANNKAAILQAVENMRYLGKTPLTAAVQQAAIQLRHTEEAATVILITDGEETCKADPCALGTELAASGVDFTAHVVGLGLTQQQGEHVACLAHNTGGQYFSANDAAKLSEALHTALQAPRAVPPATPLPKPEPVLPDATLEAAEAAEAGTVIDISWTGPDSRDDFITITPAGARDDETGEYERVSRGNPLKLQAPDALGPHEIRYVLAEGNVVLARQPIELIPLQVTISGPSSVGAGGTIQVQWAGPNSPGDYITVVPASAPDSAYADYARTASGNPVTFSVPDAVGNHEIRYILDSSKRVLAAQPITLTPVTATLELVGEATPAGTATVNWTGPDNKGDYVTVVPKGAPAHHYLDYARTSHGSPLKINLPKESGEYELRYVIDRSKRVLASQPLILSESLAAASPSDTPAPPTR